MMGNNSKANSSGGNWIAISRDMRDHPIVGFGQPMKPADPKRGAYSRAEAWIDLISEARWTPGEVNNKGKVIELARGALMAARSWLASRWNWSENAVRWFLDKLEKESMIRRNHHHSNARERRHYANVISIENYDIFQTASELLERMPTIATTNQPPINHQSTTNQPPESNKETKEQENKAAAGMLEEIEGLNGATVLIERTIAKWMNPYAPDYRCAREWLTNSVKLFGSGVVKDAFASVQGKQASGDLVGQPIKLMTAICQGKANDRQKAAGPDIEREKPAGMSDKLWRKILSDREKAKNGEHEWV